MKAELRARCRKKWGKEWYKVHPVIKKARLVWATGEVDLGNAVRVFESGGSYVV